MYQIMEVQKEIGQVVVTLHKQTTALNALLEKHDAATVNNAKNTTKEILDAYNRQVDALKQKLEELQKTMTDKTEKLSSNLSGKVQTFNEFKEVVDEDWARIRKVADIVLKNNGYDPVTLTELPDSIKKLNWLFDKFSSVLISLIISGFLSLVLVGHTKKTETNALELNTKTMQMMDSIQQQLQAHIKEEQAMHHDDEPVRPKRR